MPSVCIRFTLILAWASRVQRAQGEDTRLRIWHCGSLLWNYALIALCGDLLARAGGSRVVHSSVLRWPGRRSRTRPGCSVHIEAELHTRSTLPPTTPQWPTVVNIIQRQKGWGGGQKKRLKICLPFMGLTGWRWGEGWKRGSTAAFHLIRQTATVIWLWSPMDHANPHLLPPLEVFS